MRTKVLVTNGGPHSADDLGLATAEQITDTDPNITEDRKIAAAKLRLQIAELLSHYHQINQQEERDRLSDLATSTTEHEDDLVYRALAKVMVATTASPWQEHYAKPEVQEIIRYIIAKDLAHSRHIERDWHRQKDST